MHLKTGLIILTCLLGVVLAACGDAGSTEKPETAVSGPAISSPLTDTPAPSLGGDSTPDSSIQSKPTPVTEDPGKAAADTLTPASPKPVPTAAPVTEDPGKATADTPTPASPNPVPTATPAAEDPGRAEADTPTPVSPTPASPTPMHTATPVTEPTPTPSLKVGPEVGRAAPDFTVTTVDGEVLTLSTFLGNKPFILYFFATW